MQEITTIRDAESRYGDVRELARAIDDRMIVMGSGDELVLRFPAVSLPPLSVEPLPFHGMSAYPYPEAESYPDTPSHREYRDRYNTRPALWLLRPLTVATPFSLHRPAHRDTGDIRR